MKESEFSTRDDVIRIYPGLKVEYLAAGRLDRLRQRCRNIFPGHLLLYEGQSLLPVFSRICKSFLPTFFGDGRSIKCQPQGTRIDTQHRQPSKNDYIVKLRVRSEKQTEYQVELHLLLKNGGVEMNIHGPQDVVRRWFLQGLLWRSLPNSVILLSKD